MLVRLGQEVQALPRRVTAPPAPLVGTSICLDPITADAAGDLERLARDEAMRRFTRVPSEPRDGFGAEWAARYVQRLGRTAAAPASRSAPSTATFLGMAMLRRARPRRPGRRDRLRRRPRRRAAAASPPRRCGLLTAGASPSSSLERIELLIDVDNPASERVAERCGYTREGRPALGAREGRPARRTLASGRACAPTDRPFGEKSRSCRQSVTDMCADAGIVG